MDERMGNALTMDNADAIREKIVAMEREALDRWGSGDPGGFLEINDPDVSYFDPFQEKRLDGLDRLTALLVKLDDDRFPGGHPTNLRRLASTR